MNSSIGRIKQIFNNYLTDQAHGEMGFLYSMKYLAIIFIVHSKQKY